MATLNDLVAAEADCKRLEAELGRLKSDYEIQMRKTDVAEAENERLRAALQDIITNADNGNWTLPSSFANRARGAVEQEARKS